jgi:GNAT superfamily N-acetyltransferase
MKDGYTIRAATEADVEVIARHRRAMFADALGPFDEGDLAAMDASFIPFLQRGLEDGSYSGWLACSVKDRAVASGGLILHEWLAYPWDPDPRRAYIANVYTEPQARGRGIARRIVTTILDWCRNQGLRVVYLHSSPQARPLYESIGFEPTNEMRLEL